MYCKKKKINQRKKFVKMYKFIRLSYQIRFDMKLFFNWGPHTRSISDRHKNYLISSVSPLWDDSGAEW